MDGDYGANEWDGPLTFKNSLFVLSTVMSTPAPDRVILDAGLKSTLPNAARLQSTGRRA